MLQTATITKQTTKEKPYRIIFDTRKDYSYEAWIRCRQNYITGTDAGNIAGIGYKSPYRVYLEKKNLAPKEPENNYMRFGRLLQPVIFEAYKQESKLDVRQVPYMLASTRYPWMAANLDGVVRLPSNEWAVLEIKNVSQRMGDTQWGRSETVNLPAPYLAQVYHYCICCNLTKAVVVALIGGCELHVQTIEIKQEIADMLISLEKDFYFNNLKRNIPPPVTSSDSSWLSKVYDKPESKTIALPESAERLVADYMAAAREIKRWQEQKDHAEAQIKEMMKEADTAYVSGQKISWKSFESKKLDLQKVKQILTVQQISELSTVSKSRRFVISPVKK